jgi:hypothetical protein
MAGRQLVILRYAGKAPPLASCANCQRKFLTPAPFANDAVGADRYLTHKFDLHRSQKTGDERRLWPTSTLIQHGSSLSISLLGC